MSHGFAPNQRSPGQKESPKVAVVVLNWNDRESTLHCVRSLLDMEYPDTHLLVVDNGSADGSADFLRRNFPGIALLENRTNLGCAGGFNVGIRRALEIGAEYVVCLNNDTIVDRRFVSELVRVGENYRNAGGLCPKEYSYFEPARIVYAGGTLGLVRGRNRGFGELDQGKYERVTETGMLCGAAMVLKSSALSQVGLLDSRFFFDWEDKDMAFRLSRHGCKLVYVPSAKLWHKGRWATRGAVPPFRTYFSVRNGLLFAKKHYGACTGVLFAFVFLAISLWSVAASPRSRVASLRSLVMAIIWHLNPELLPSDNRIVALLSG